MKKIRNILTWNSGHCGEGAARSKSDPNYYAELVLDDDMSMLSDDSIFAKQMVTPPAGSPVDVDNVDTPRDTDYERPYSGMCLGEEQDDGDPDHAPTEHRWQRLQGRTDLGPNIDINSSPLPHPWDFFPLPPGPHINPLLSTYELIREANIQVRWCTSLFWSDFI